MDEADRKVEYYCGICQQKIHRNFPTIVCTTCNKWIHKRCVTIPWEEAEKNKHVFKCKNCEGKGEAPKIANDPNIKDVEKLTDTVLLSGTGTQSFCRNISNADLESLENGKWVTDGIISLIFGNIQRNVNGSKLALVEPSITQMLRKSPDSYLVAKTVKDLKLNEKDYVFFPVNNNNKLDGEGGSHWSLLVYASDKRHRGFYHHDPISGTNLQHATELMEFIKGQHIFQVQDGRSSRLKANKLLRLWHIHRDICRNVSN